MYPFYNPYMSLMARQQEEERLRREEAAKQRRGQFLVPGTWGGEDVSPEAGRLARGRGLLAFGTSLLGLDAARDPGAALGRGVSGFADALTGTLEEQRQIGRQREEDERKREQEADRQRQADLAFQSGTAELEEFRDKQQRGRDLRVRTGKGAGDMVREIEMVAGADSPEAGQARALAGLGEEADLNRLAQLHDAATKRARRDEDADWATQQDIESVRAKVLAGVEEDPLAAGRRAERGLELEARRTELYGANMGGAAKAPTAAQYTDDVRAEASRIFARKKLALEATASGRIRPPVQQPDGSFAVPPAFTDADLRRIEQEAQAEAEGLVRQRYGQRGAAGAAGEATATVEDVETKLGRVLTPAERAEVTEALRLGYTLDRILRAL